MRKFWSSSKPDLNPGTPLCERGTGEPVVGGPFDGCPTGPLDDAIQVDSCPAFERIVVTTRQSVYEVIVLRGDVGEVMVRGGRVFPEFRHATVAGSSAGGSALKVRNIAVGLQMELHVDGKPFITSTIQEIFRSNDLRVTALEYNVAESRPSL